MKLPFSWTLRWGGTTYVAVVYGYSTERTYVVPAESRTLTVAAELRTYSVSAQDRTYSVRGE